jgi:hypothetical protein
VTGDDELRFAVDVLMDGTATTASSDSVIVGDIDR